MNYAESKEILAKLKASGKLLLSLHRSPDPDSIGANLAMCAVLSKLGCSDIEIVSPDQISNDLKFLENSDKIKEGEVAKDYLEGRLFIALDTAVPKMLSNDPAGFDLVKADVIVIDHHLTNSKFGQINLVDPQIGSTCELLYYVFEDWEVEIDSVIAQSLFTGLVGDTGAFRYKNATTARTLRVSADLLERGASLEKTIYYLYQSNTLETFRYWSKVLSKIVIKKVGPISFAWSALTFDELRDFGNKDQLTGPTDMFFQSIDGTNFGMTLIEKEEGMINGSIRSRTGIDISLIAVALGGGGHKEASGFRLELDGLSFDEGVKKILAITEEVLENK